MSSDLEGYGANKSISFSARFWISIEVFDLYSIGEIRELNEFRTPPLARKIRKVKNLIKVLFFFTLLLLLGRNIIDWVSK